jgi:tetratricopeptide (TPR) repeat protein
MARVDRRRTKGTKPNAAVAKTTARKPTMAPAIEDTMFFPRLRRHAKWMFVFLALVFAVGFVGFGVGAGGTGIGDILRNSGSSSGVPSVSEARKQTVERPSDPQAWRDLSTALQTEGQTEEAIRALRTYTGLKPGDIDGRRELAGLYLALATAKANEVQEIQLQAAFAGASQSFPGSLSVDGTSIVDNKIGQAVNAKASEQVTAAVNASNAAASSAVTVYEQIADLQPNDPNVQLELASTAQQVRNNEVAIKAYERFLVLAPDDPNVPIVKAQLKQLKKQVSASTSG